MLTLRALPGRADPGNSLLAAYHEGLARHWPLRRRMLARALAVAGKGGWSRAESLLLDDAVRAQGLSMRDRKGLHRLLNPGAFPFQTNPLKNKQLFARIAEAAGLPVAEQWDPEREPLALWLAGQQDVIAKPSYRSKGQGVERFRRTAGGWKRDDTSLDEVVVAAHLRAVREAGGVVQRRLPTHQALEDVSPGALPTLRVVTCLDEQGEPEACETALRLSAGGPRPVDNFNAGNLVLLVDGRG
ncbi:sugar-transfer associated ATP-grasp domain-containing protein, partial [Sphingobium ummariense]